MADARPPDDPALGLTAARDRVTRTEAIAAILSVAWLVVAGAFFLLAPSAPVEEPFDSLRFVMVLLSIFLPVAMIWVVAAAARSARIVREESRRLQAAIDAMRKSYVNERQARGATIPDAGVERKLAEIATSARKTETALATFATTRTALPNARKPMVPEAQPTLALGTSAEDMAPPLPRADLIRAINFPDTDRDETGFAALRRALTDRSARQLIQASQDILTLLSQDGIYMDDMRPDRARPDIWRRFARGERGRAIAGLGGIRDRTSLALTGARMREDTIFRDAAHHFLRLFDRMLAAFEADASDEEIAHLSETRTARAFMLLGRAAGTFD